MFPVTWSKKQKIYLNFHPTYQFSSKTFRYIEVADKKKNLMQTWDRWTPKKNRTYPETAKEKKKKRRHRATREEDHKKNESSIVCIHHVQSDACVRKVRGRLSPYNGFPRPRYFHLFLLWSLKSYTILIVPRFSQARMKVQLRTKLMPCIFHSVSRPNSSFFLFFFVPLFSLLLFRAICLSALATIFFSSGKLKCSRRRLCLHLIFRL